MRVKIFLALLCLSYGQASAGTRDLAADVETAHGELLIHSGWSSNCFFRTNDIKALINGRFVDDVSYISDLFRILAVDEVVIEKFRADMAQTQESANNLLQLQMNTFRGYELRLHTYAENLLTDLSLTADNLVQLKKDTSDTKSIYLAVDNNLTTYINFLNAEVLGILGDSTGVIADDARTTLESMKTSFAEARQELSVEKDNFDAQAPITETSLQTVVDQVL